MDFTNSAHTRRYSELMRRSRLRLRVDDEAQKSGMGTAGSGSAGSGTWSVSVTDRASVIDTRLARRRVERRPCHDGAYRAGDRALRHIGRPTRTTISDLPCRSVRATNRGGCVRVASERCLAGAGCTPSAGAHLTPVIRGGVAVGVGCGSDDTGRRQQHTRGGECRYEQFHGWPYLGVVATTVNSQTVAPRVRATGRILGRSGLRFCSSAELVGGELHLLIVGVFDGRTASPPAAETFVACCAGEVQRLTWRQQARNSPF
jgi:hypothetical protein